MQVPYGCKGLVAHFWYGQSTRVRSVPTVVCSRRPLRTRAAPDDSDHRAVKATLRSLVAPKKKKVLKDDRQKLMRLDYAILQSEEGRDELARRALEILNSKSDDKTSYEAIADALHL